MKQNPLPKVIFGVDAIRFICAAIVVMGHFNVFPASFDGRDFGRMVEISVSLTKILWNGPAAVIVFFIISGFCIHYPQFRKGSDGLDIGSFYLKRFMRIGIPAAIVICVYIPSGADMKYPGYGVLVSTQN